MADLPSYVPPDGFVSGNDDQMSGAEADFGPLEMFSSNATQEAFSLPTHAVPFALSAPESEPDDAAAPASSKSTTRGKKSEKKKAAPSSSLHHDGKKKHKKKQVKSTKSDHRSEPTDSGLQNDDARSTAGTPSGLNGNDEALELSTESKKKRKSSDSSNGKRRKKRRPHDSPAKAEGSAEPVEATASAADFLRRKEDLGESAVDENDPPESDSRRSPTVARLQRRSQSREARSREDSIHSRADADRMEVDPDTEQATTTAAKDDTEFGALAREAWNEHQNGQDAPGDTRGVTKTRVPLTEPPDLSPRRTRSTRKKAKPTFFEQPPAEDSTQEAEANREALAELPSPTAMTPKPRNRNKAASKNTGRGKRPERQPQSAAEEEGEEGEGGRRRRKRLGYTQGRFSADELSRIGSAVESFRVENELTKEQVVQMVHAPGGTTAGDAHAQLWARIFAECPDRHRQKVINTTRKRFHNFIARGTWTLEQDAQLSELINVHGTKWSKIASLINRHPEDLRDRYRNYLVCGQHQRKDAWDEDEEARLTKYVIDAMVMVDELRQSELANATPNQVLLERSYEELIDWQSISERMGRTRSRLQCITKWKSLNIRTNGKDKLVSSEPDARISFRLEKARRQILAMPEEEKFRLVLAIQDTSVGKDAKIPWQRLVDKHFRNKWHRLSQMLLWRRLRQAVPDWEIQTTRDCARYLVEYYNQAGQLPEDPVDGYDDRLEMEFLQNTPPPSMGVHRKERGEKSAELIVNSDAENDEAATNGNRVIREDNINIDPALTQVPMPTKKVTLAKRTGSGKRKTDEKAPTANMDSIEHC